MSEQKARHKDAEGAEDAREPLLGWDADLFETDAIASGLFRLRESPLWPRIGWFFGPHSGFAAFVALAMIMIGLLSRGLTVKRPELVGWCLFASLAIGQSAAVLAVLLGLLPDASVTPLHRVGQSIGQLIASHFAIQALYFSAFVTGRLFQRRYNEQWLIVRHGFRTPNQSRTDFAAASKGLDAGPTCRNVG